MRIWLGSLACVLAAASGCFSVGAVDAGSGEYDGGTVELSPDSGVDPPILDAGGPPPPQDAGPPSVAITSFGADTTTLGYLDSTYLTWAVQASTGCDLQPGFGAVTLPGGSQLIESGDPDTSVTYTLTCQGRDGPVSQSVTVTTALVTRPGETVTTAAQLSAFAGVNVVTGDLIIDGPTGTDLSDLSVLLEVTGSLIIANMAGLQTASLPALKTVGRGLAFDENGPLATLDLPVIERVESKLYVSRNFSLPQSEIDDVVTTLQAASGIGGPVIDYYNRPEQVIGTLDQVMLCSLMGDGGLWRLDLYPNGTLDLWQPTGINFVYAGSGTYQANQGQLRFQAPGLIADQTTTSVEIEYDKLVEFKSATLQECSLWKLPFTGDASITEYQCLFVDDGTLEERNTVTLAPDGEASWSYTVVHPSLQGGQGTQVVPGAYIIDGDWYLFAFGVSVSPLRNLRFPVARLNGAQTELHFEDLISGQNPCTAQ
jgi:hypothetical protein